MREIERRKREWSELQVRLIEWDPLGLRAAGASVDEYEWIAEELHQMLLDGADARQITSYLKREFNDTLMVRLKGPGTRLFANALHQWFLESKTDAINGV